MPILHWIGKDKVLNHHLIVPTKTLKASPSPSEGGELKCVTSKGEEPKWIPSEVGHSCSSKGSAYSSSPPKSIAANTSKPHKLHLYRPTL